MSLIKPKAPRWYRDENGVVEACYTMPKKDGSGIKDTTLREAKELGLLPSVTSILRVMAQPGLERWKLEQVIHSAMTLPRMPGEMEDAFAKRVVEDSEAQAAKAAEFGTRIHDAIAGKFLGDEHYHHPSDLEPYLESFEDWAYDNIEEAHAFEKVVGGKRCGYAGRLDLECTLRGVGRCVVDFKTQGIKEGKSPVFYPDWPKQLAAYREAVFPEDGYWDRKTPYPKIVSIVIDSSKPGPIWPKVWDDSHWDYWDLFFGNYREWIYINDYDPCQPVFDPTAGVKQAREDYALKQMGILPKRELDS